MKPIKLGLRAWFSLTALAGFFSGWALLAHAGKPAWNLPAVVAPGNNAGSSVSPADPVPTLVPLPFSGNSSNSQSGLQPLPAQPQLNFGQPRLRTRGS